MNPENNANVCHSCSCKCGHHMVGAAAIILIGVAFLLNAFNVLSWYATSIIWPILLIVAASGKLCRCCCRK